MSGDELIEVLTDMGYDYEYVDLIKIAYLPKASIAANTLSNTDWKAHIKGDGGLVISTRELYDVFDLQDWLINEYERYLDKRR